MGRIPDQVIRLKAHIGGVKKTVNPNLNMGNVLSTTMKTVFQLNLLPPTQEVSCALHFI